MSRYVIRYFTVMTRKDYNHFMNIEEFSYKTYQAKLYNNYEIEVNGVVYTNKEFQELYTENLC